MADTNTTAELIQGLYDAAQTGLMIKDYNGNLAQATAADWQRLIQRYMEQLAEQVGITLYKD